MDSNIICHETVSPQLRKIYQAGLKEGWLESNEWSGILMVEGQNPFDDQVTVESIVDDTQTDPSSYTIQVYPAENRDRLKTLAPLLLESCLECSVSISTPLIRNLLEINVAQGADNYLKLGKRQNDFIPIFQSFQHAITTADKGITRFLARDEQSLIVFESTTEIKSIIRGIESRAFGFVSEISGFSTISDSQEKQVENMLRQGRQILRLHTLLQQENHSNQHTSPPSEPISTEEDDVLAKYLDTKLEPPPPVITEDPETNERVLQAGRKVNYLAPMSTGLSVGINIFMVMCFVTKVITETLVDRYWLRLLMLILVPFFMCISQFLWDNLVSFIAQVFFPIKHLHENSLYYSGHASEPLPDDHPLPSFTIHMPCYKEGLHSVLKPSLESANEAVKAYRAMGGVANIIVSEDGLRLLSQEEASERITYYNSMNFGWVARPRHGDNYTRKGRFKKASNLNFTYTLSLRIEEIMDELRPTLKQEFQNQDLHEDAFEERLYDLAFQKAIQESEGKAWASGNVRVGDYVLLIDSDTRMKPDCLAEAAAEMERSPEVGALQHCSGVMYVRNHYFERFIGYFTSNCINFSISWNCANGAMAPLMGHNVFLRWRAMQEVSKMEDDKELSVFSPHHVSEDFEMALKLQLKGYIVRWATYSDEGFTEGVSFTPEDEVTRYQKYAYGCSEIVFNPLRYWITRSPFSKLFREFLVSNVPLAYKFATLSYLSTYYALAVSFPLGITMFVVQGLFQDTLDGVFLPAFDVWMTVSLIFTLVGGPGLIIARARSGHDTLGSAIKSFFTHLPATVAFFSGLAFHIMLALFAHLIGYNMTWTTTNKDFRESSIGQVFRRFKNVYIVSFLGICAITLLCSPLLDVKWRIDPAVAEGMSALIPPLIMLFFHVGFPLLLDPGMLHHYIPDLGETTNKVKQKTTSFFHAAGDRIKEKYDTRKQVILPQHTIDTTHVITRLPSTSDFGHSSTFSHSEKYY